MRCHILYYPTYVKCGFKSRYRQINSGSDFLLHRKQCFLSFCPSDAPNITGTSYLMTFNYLKIGKLFQVLLKAQVSLQLGKIFSSDNEDSVYIMYSYMY